MKKTLITIATLAAALVSTAAARPITMTAPQSEWKPVFSADAVITDLENAEHLSGFRLGLGLYNESGKDYHHQVTLSVAPSFGSDDATEIDYTYTPMALGYDAYFDANEKLQLYVGGKIGFAKYSAEWEDDETSETGTYFALGFGARYNFSETRYLQFGYEYGRCDIDFGDGNENTIGSHSVSVGIGFKF